MKSLKIIALFITAVIATGCATTGGGDSGPHKVVIQVSSKDALTQKIAVNNAVNVMKEYGPGEVVVEIVAYGPGLSMLTKKNKQSKRIKGLALSDGLTFSACNNTMKKIKKKDILTFVHKCKNIYMNIKTGSYSPFFYVKNNID